METKQPPVFMYILMRADLASMNPGKAVAQGTHAANQCVFEAREFLKGLMNDHPLAQMLNEWEAETGKGFGTCICLSVTERQMREKVDFAKRFGFHAGITHDPTYPLKDGGSFHLIPLDTCGFVFGRKNDMLAYLMSDLELMA